jgi:hypothetical protein
MCSSDYIRVFDWWSYVSYSLIQCVTILYSSLLRTHISVHSQVFTSRCLVMAPNGGHVPSSGFPDYPHPELPASHSNSSQWLNLSSSLTTPLTDWLTLITHQPDNSKSKLCYNQRSVGQSVLEKRTHMGLKTRSLLLTDSCKLVDVGCSLWR